MRGWRWGKGFSVSALCILALIFQEDSLFVFMFIANLNCKISAANKHGTGPEPPGIEATA